jgi:NTE family protein
MRMQRVMVVLGGGGVKGMAHAGAWRAIEESGVEVSGVVGTSIGALVGACVAGGQGWRELTARALALTKPDIVLLNRWTLLLNGIRQPSVFRGDTLRTYIESVLPVREFGELRLPLSVNAVDLQSGAQTWFGAGGRMDVALADAVYASCALPVFYPPAQIGDRYYVDGGAADALPVAWAAERGAELIVAIDVGSGSELDAAQTVEKGLVAIQHRVFSMMSFARKRAQLDAWAGPPLLYVRPRLEEYATFDFESTEYFLEEGYRATRSALETLPGGAELREERAG